MSTATYTAWEQRIYCITEGAFVHKITKAAAEPSALSSCPNDPGHATQQGSASLVDAIGPARTTIEHGDNTGGHFAWDCVVVDVADPTPGTVVTVTKQWPVPTCVWSAQITSEEVHRGDALLVDVAPDVVVGTLTLAVDAGQTLLLGVSPSALANVQVGYHLKLDDGVNTCDLGRAVVVGGEGAGGEATVTVSVATTAPFAPGTLVRRTVRFANVVFGAPQTFALIGGDLDGGSLVPAGVSVRLTYTNTSGGSKKMHCYLSTTY